MREWTVRTTRLEPLDLDQTLGCGQTFRWARREDGSWAGVVGESVVRLRKTGRGLEVRSRPGDEGVVDRVRDYLRASDDIASIQRRLAADPVLRDRLEGLRGLRIVRMDGWECIVSYILATYANIPRIRRMIDRLSERFGEEICDGVHAFPSMASLRTATVDELRRCGLGYRARYLHELCRALDDGSVEALRRLGHEELREELKSLPGVGDKVADCISLFGFGHLESFPIDVWVARALERLYGTTGPYRRLREFAEDRFGPFAGYAQEYLYHNERTVGTGGRCAFSREANGRSAL